VMPSGYDDWEPIWARRTHIPTVYAPRLLDAVQHILGPQVAQLRPFPWAPKPTTGSREGDDLGIAARVFPQWLRCTGCNMLGPLTRFTYKNTNPYRPDQAQFLHNGCRGRFGKVNPKPVPTVPARYLLVCTNGHIDEFPYDWWVHHGEKCHEGNPRLEMTDRSAGRGQSTTITCKSCNSSRSMREAQGENGAGKLPRCRGRHPHIGIFAKGGCPNQTKLMLLGASNIWFPAFLSSIVLPGIKGDPTTLLANDLAAMAGEKRVERYGLNLDKWREYLDDEDSPLAKHSDADILAALQKIYNPPSDEQLKHNRDTFDSDAVLLLPEWRYLEQDPQGAHHKADDESGLVISPPKGGVSPFLREIGITRIHAIDKLRKANAIIGFTRVDPMDRVDDAGGRLAPLVRKGRPTWTVATDDNGEGIFIQLDEAAVAAWEKRIEESDLWKAHKEAYRRYYSNHLSPTAKHDEADEHLKPPRYWLLHMLSHALIREAAMFAGYSAASLSERIYAWKGDENKPPAAGLMIVTTASDSDGTLGGLVALSEKDRLERLVKRALTRAHRCSSDPVCANRTPKDPEDFLHGAACHTCAMASETSCELANRFLDRRFLVNLPGWDYGFFTKS